ncbi:MAG TPA: hypothetical protein DEA22_10860, partial [Blastocatellia bacterium]|nr:hypothetical protein [Blastocatellia bacterium]
EGLPRELTSGILLLVSILTTAGSTLRAISANASDKPAGEITAEVFTGSTPPDCENPVPAPQINTANKRLGIVNANFEFTKSLLSINIKWSPPEPIHWRMVCLARIITKTRALMPNFFGSSNALM